MYNTGTGVLRLVTCSLLALTSAAPAPQGEGRGRDVCSLPPSAGPCNGTLTRYFYDPETRTCRQFTYSGCDGNGNKFRSERGCQRQCYDRCSLPMEVGPCDQPEEKWFYNSTSSTCESFMFSGCRGNRNRFATQTSCQDECAQEAQAASGSYDSTGRCSLPQDTGPCRADIPKFYFNQESGQCEMFSYGGCQGNANRFKTISACNEACSSNRITENSPPELEDPPVHAHDVDEVCLLPSATGPCRASMPRWFYNSGTQQCEQFTYGGCDGNDNRFATPALCEARCSSNVPSRSGSNPQPDSNQESNIPEECLLPRLTGSCRAAIQSWGYNSETQKCQRFTYGGCNGNGNRFSTEAACETRCVPGPGDGGRDAANTIPEKCQLPFVVGHCRAAKRVYAYDMETGQCKRFIYGGCGGNANRFATEELCQKECSIRSSNNEAEANPVQHGSNDNLSELCNLPLMVGPCRARMPSWYYNSASAQCERFYYGGCDGNNNRFATELLCRQRCAPSSVQDQTPNRISGESPYGLGDSNPDPHPICSLPPTTGMCKARFRKFFYNPKTRSCETFIYGGCGGNENNFATAADCQRRCVVDRSTNAPDVDATNTGTSGQNGPVAAHQINPTCMQPYKTGPCRALLGRFYYNSRLGRCTSFIYGGCRGNENNFRSAQQCEETCMQDARVPSLVVGTDTGNDRDATPAPDVCRLPRVVGPCKARMNRFYFNVAMNQCVTFAFGGCRGNGNNFRSLSECQNRCPTLSESPENSSETTGSDTPVNRCHLPADTGPCRANKGRWFYNKQTYRCESFVYGGCSGNMNNFETYAACQQGCGNTYGEGEADENELMEGMSNVRIYSPSHKCMLPHDAGLCSAMVRRWFFDPASLRCEQFSYGGCGGNENNFLSKVECEESCLAPIIQSGPDPQTNTQNPDSSTPTCSLPVDVGPCYASIPRWSYISHLNECQVFVYGGCGGNENNFETSDACTERCITEEDSDEDEEPLSNDPVHEPIQQFCHLPPIVGPCRARMSRWYYNSQVGRCVNFIYGGCRGNENQFRDLDSCQAACMADGNATQSDDNTSPVIISLPGTDDGSDEDPDQQAPDVVPGVPAICQQPKVVGRCYALFRRWYYNTTSQSCEQFNYGGCDGNENNFQDLAACQEACQG